MTEDVADILGGRRRGEPILLMSLDEAAEAYESTDRFDVDAEEWCVDQLVELLRSPLLLGVARAYYRDSADYADSVAEIACGDRCL